MFNGGSQQYPGVPYGPGDFHQPYCDVNNYQDPNNVRNCYLASLNDLNGGKWIASYSFLQVPPQQALFTYLIT